MEEKLLYPELSFQIVGCGFQVYNNVGFGMAEKFYQKAFALGLEQKGLSFVREKKCVMEYMGKPLSSFFLDFVVEDSVVVELKVRPRLGYVHIKQVKEYLKVTGLKLAILIYFTKDGVKYRRVLNTY